jgi:A nuclease family of the HNH/ENDO VII superfamily with conserved AHH
MTEIAEGVMMSFITEHTSPCELCSEAEKPPKRKTNVDANWEDDPGAAIGNDSGDLEDAMKAQGLPRPTDWRISGKVGRLDLSDHVVTPNPHHLVPGNESLKQSNLLEWLFEGDKINGDVGYDVNNDRNGVWLPSNNAMRGNPAWSDAAVKRDYVIKAMAVEVSGGHFHDRHGRPYSQFVTKILNKLADRLNGVKHVDVNCPYETSKGADGKYNPPFYLYTRLNGVSKRMARYLSSVAPRQDFVYTSKLVLIYWDDQETPYLQAALTA